MNLILYTSYGRSVTKKHSSHTTFCSDCLSNKLIVLSSCICRRNNMYVSKLATLFRNDCKRYCRTTAGDHSLNGSTPSSSPRCQQLWVGDHALLAQGDPRNHNVNYLVCHALALQGSSEKQPDGKSSLVDAFSRGQTVNRNVLHVLINGGAHTCE